MKESKFLSLNWLDLAKAFLVALIVLILQFAQETFIPALNISPEMKVFLITTIGYLVKNFFTKPKE
jgi:hypothetical protein